MVKESLDVSSHYVLLCMVVTSSVNPNNNIIYTILWIKRIYAQWHLTRVGLKLITWWKAERPCYCRGKTRRRVVYQRWREMLAIMVVHLEWIHGYWLTVALHLICWLFKMLDLTICTVKMLNIDKLISVMVSSFSEPCLFKTKSRIRHNTRVLMIRLLQGNERPLGYLLTSIETPAVEIRQP